MVKLSKLLVGIGFIVILFSSFASILELLPEDLDFTYLTMTGTVCIASGLILKSKTPFDK